MISVRIAVCVLLLSLVGTASAQIEVHSPALESDKYQKMASDLHEAKLLEEFAAALNESLKLPVPVGVRFAECGEANAFYDPSEQQISMCFELLEDYYETMADQYETQDELDAAVMGAFVLVLFHELGHALGLSHPFDDAIRLPTEVDTNQYTMMSYTAHPNGNGTWPITPMLYDIQAMQALYGANMTTRAQNDVYFGGGAYGVDAASRKFFGHF